MNSLLHQLEKHAVETPEKTALVFAEDKSTYGELWESITRIASYFKSIGIKHGDRVAVQAKNSKYYALVCYACWLSHAVFVPLDCGITKQKLTEITQFLETEYSIADCGLISYGKIAGIAKDCSYSPEVIPAFPCGNDYANIMFTTGTTGKPKGAIWTHENITYNCLARYEMFAFDGKTVDMSCVALNHAAPLWKMYSVNYYGGTCILLDGFSDMNRIYNLIRDYRVSSFYTSPSGISVIQILSPEIFSDNADSLKIISVSSSSMNDKQSSFIKNTLSDCRVFFSYGASESGADTFYCLSENQKDSCCVGKPCHGVEIIITDEKLNEVKPLQTGLLLIKSKMTFPGYWKEKELNTDCFHNGYFISSDIGYKDNDGYVYITGRKDDIINIGGLKVYPSEIEKAALELEDVKECICFAIDDTITKQAACLQIVSDAETPETIITIRKHLMSRLDAYKVPKTIEFTVSIEKTPNGKPSRKLQAEKRKSVF